MVFYPTPNHNEHRTAEELLTQICQENKVSIVNCPHYYQLPTSEKDIYMQNFSEASLLIRSLPDKLILAKSPILVDAKSTVRKDTGSIAIELSSFYFSLQRCRSGLSSFFAYALNGELRFFSPLLNPPSAIFIQSKWQTNKAIQIFAQEIKHYFEPSILREIPIRNLETAGSGDPFILIGVSNINSLVASEVIKCESCLAQTTEKEKQP